VAAETGHGTSPIDPLHQFQIHELIPIKPFGLNLSFTNSALFMIVAVGVISLFMLASVSQRALIPGRAQSVSEVVYEFVNGMVRENAGHEALRYFPFIFTLFVFILIANLLGLLPYSFTVTSHIVVTAALGLFSFLLVTAIGFVKYGVGYLRLFVPEGVPGWLLPLLVPIEIVSYLIRPFSLSVRLFANMVAGHMMLKVFAGFVILLGFIGGWLPLIMIVALFALELLVAVLQAYVFAMLVSIYLNDALHMHP
jgi:F-type H+-transporting ATPase subunit a